MGTEIWGIGHCCQDSICIVEDYPSEDGSTHIVQVDDSQGGGAVATAMVAASRLGAHAGLLANLGDDSIGERILNQATAEKLDCSLVRRIAGGRSSSSIVMVNPHTGSRTKFPYRDNLPELDFTPQVQSAIASAHVLHLDGTRYINALRGAKLARQHGVTVSLDGCSMQTDNRLNLELVALCDIVITNARYPCRVTGRDSLTEALGDLAALGPRVVAITAGSEGSYLWQDGHLLHIPPFEVQVLDSTGAGDTFHGAFLAQWLREPDPITCMRFASAAAALKCREYGGRAGIPTREKVMQLLSQSSQ